jgi:preprotein translocase subunit SecG
MDRENIMSQFWAILFLTLFIIICFLLVIVVLLQKGRGGGLGAAFGGAGNAAFGTRTGDVFTWITIVLTALFLLLAVTATVLVKPPMRNASEPRFDPPAQPIEEAMSVQIRCDTPRTKVYYTLDGSTPSKASKEYIKAIMVQPGVTVEAISIGDETNPSNVAVGKYPLRTAETEPESQPATAPSTKPASGHGTLELPPKTKTPATAGAKK